MSVDRRDDAPLVFVNYSKESFTPTQSGALATYIYECSRRLRDAGHDVRVLSLDDGAPTFQIEGLILLRARPLPDNSGTRLAMRAWRKTTGWPELGRRAWAGRVARALRDAGLGEARLLLQNDPEVAVVLRRHLPSARIFHLFQNQLSAREPFRAAFAGAVDGVAAVSNFTASWVEDFYKLPPKSVMTIYSGVDAAAFQPLPDKTPVPIIGFVGRTGIEKAPDLVLRAGLLLAESRTDFGVQLVGSNHWDRFTNDDYQIELSRLTADLQRRGIDVVRTGHLGRAELPAALARCAIHVVPSRWDEPFGLTTLEGMASGCALVASATGGTPEVVGDAGLLFARDDVSALASTLEGLLDDPAAREEWARKSRERALELTWDRTATHLESWTRTRR